jgi:tetratricopeptide (TPR) repeat protein
MKKKIFCIFGALMFIGLLVLIGSAVKPKKTGTIDDKPVFQDQIVVNLDVEQKKEIEKQISDTQGKLDAAKKQNVPQAEIEALNLGLAFNKYVLGDLKGALESYTVAANIVPTNPKVWAGLYFVYRDMGDFVNAEDSIKKAVKFNKEDWNMWRNYIDLEQYQFKASKDELDKIYKQALDGTKNNLNIVTFYAQFLEANNDLQSALNYWKIALEQEPDNLIYKSEVSRLKKLLHQK